MTKSIIDPAAALNKASFNMWMHDMFSDSSPFDSYLKAITRKAIKELLTPRQFEVISMIYGLGMQQIDIAVELKICDSAVTRHKQAALKRLKKFLEYNVHYKAYVDGGLLNESISGL